MEKGNVTRGIPRELWTDKVTFAIAPTCETGPKSILFKVPEAGKVG